MPEGTPDQYYRQVAELITSDPTIKWNASQLAAGTITSIQQVNGTPVTTFNLNNSQLIMSDGTTRRLLIGLKP